MNHDASTIQRIGVLLAAGRGRRMGRTKQLVAWSTAAGTKPLVAAAYDAIRLVCDEMVVVLGHEADAVAAALDHHPLHRVDANPDADMFESIRAGVTAALAINRDATIVLQPGDHPEVAPGTLDLLVIESMRRPEIALMPEFQGRGGHPAFIPSGVARMLVEANCPGGLRGFWTQHVELCRRLPVEDPGVVLDINTADQLRE